jgi:hypothetical protein
MHTTTTVVVVILSLFYINPAVFTAQLRRALPSVEHFVFCHPDSSLLNTAVFCSIVRSMRMQAAEAAAAAA